MAIAELQPDSSKGDISNGFVVPRGTMMDSQTLKKSGITCSYTTAHDVTLQPVRIAGVELGGIPADIPLASLGLQHSGCVSALRIRLECYESVTLNNLQLDQLMFYLAGPDMQAQQLLELLMQHSVGLVCQTVEPQPQRRALALDGLRQEGFAADQALLPNDLRNFEGYRLLQEYFAFPARFQFFSVNGLRPLLQSVREGKKALRQFEIVVLLDRHDAALERVVDAAHLALHCTPVINLFPKVAERIAINEKPRIPSGGRQYPAAGLRSVLGAAARRQRQRKTLRARVSAVLQHPERGRRQLWRLLLAAARTAYAVGARPPLRHPHRLCRFGSVRVAGGRAAIAVAQRSEIPHRRRAVHQPRPAVDAAATGSGQLRDARLDPDQAGLAAQRPHPPRPALAEGMITWRLISQLQLNYLSMMDGDPEQGAASLRQLMGLYGNLSEPAIAKQIQGVRHCNLRPVYRRVPEPGPIVFARGIAIDLTVDEQAFSGNSPYLLGSVLERLFSRLVAMNTFTEMTLSSQQRGEIAHWQARMGKRTLI